MKRTIYASSYNEILWKLNYFGKTNFLYFREKVRLPQFRCVLNMALLLGSVSKALFVKWFSFSIFCNIFLYTQLAFVFHPEEGFYTICDHVFAF